MSDPYSGYPAPANYIPPQNFGGGPGSQYPPPQNVAGGGPGSQYPPPLPCTLKLTPEERAVLRECRRESFWRRSVPFSLGACLALSAAHNAGIVAPKYKFWQYGVASLGGFLLGKVSYMGPCMEKLKRLPNSPLYNAMMAARKGRPGEILQDVTQSSPMGEFSQYPSGGDRPSFPAGGDPYQNRDFSTQPLFPDSQSESPDVSGSKRSVSYDEMRSQNREQYFRQQQAGFQPAGAGVQNNGDFASRPPVTTAYDEMRRKNREDHWRKGSGQPARPQQPQPELQDFNDQPKKDPSQNFGSTYSDRGFS